MQPVIYDVAVSADGFICGADGDISLFPHEGAVVEDYRARLAGYAHCLMGRATYEFGYAYGLEPGANPYPWMEATVFSRSLDLPETAEVRLVREDALAAVDAIRRAAEGPVYLCGGGSFAGFLLDAGRVDLLRLKRAPGLFGRGVPLFRSDARPHLTLEEQKDYGGGLIYQAFRVSG